jgi:hypothetical protein
LTVAEAFCLLRAVSERSEQRRRYLAIALASCAVLLYEVAITRVLSVVLWYHFAFLSISLAMLGIGAPGVWYALRPPGPRALARSLIASAVAVPLSIVVIAKLGDLLPRGFGLVQDIGTFMPAGVLVLVVAVLVPLLCLGSVVCLLLIQAKGREIGRIYGADLIGATVGALLVVPLMHVAPTPWLVAASGLLPLLGAVFVGGASRRVIVGVAVVVVGALAWGEPFSLRYSKRYRETDVLFEKWTPTGRVTVFPRPFSDDPGKPWLWGMGSRYEPRALEQLWIEQDGAAGTPIVKVDGPLDALDHLDFDVTGVGYQLRPPASVCVIGSGGGRDVLTALKAGATRIDAVELSGTIVDVVSGQFSEFAGDVYARDGVNAVVDEGRSFLTGTDARYDLVQVSLIDSWAATAAGAFALSESYLYTLEAMELYLDRLSEDGLLSISRWFKGPRQLEGVRLVLMARTALAAAGVEQPERHLAVVEGESVATLLVSRRPFDREELARLDEIDRERGFVRHWPPHRGTPKVSPIAMVLVQGPAAYEAQAVDLSPPTDDRPFFFQTISLAGRVNPAIVQLGSSSEHSVLLLRWMLLVVTGLAVAAFLFPFVLARKVTAVTGSRELWRGTAYFAAIGIAFMFTEAGWVQRFILYLGHPSYATTVVLAALLLGAGLGAMAAARVSMAKVARYALALPVVVVVANLVLGPIMGATLGTALALRVVISVVVLAGAGVVMGFAFPAGMLRFGPPEEGADSRSWAWFWAMNGIASVVATVCSLALAIAIGFHDVVMLGAGAYLVAAILIRKRGAERA